MKSVVVLACLLLAACTNQPSQAMQKPPPERPPVTTTDTTTDTQFWTGPVPGQPVDWHAMPPLPAGQPLMPEPDQPPR